MTGCVAKIFFVAFGVQACYRDYGRAFVVSILDFVREAVINVHVCLCFHSVGWGWLV